jgi:hypothetical protein
VKGSLTDVNILGNSLDVVLLVESWIIVINISDSYVDDRCGGECAVTRLKSKTLELVLGATRASYHNS